MADADDHPQPATSAPGERSVWFFNTLMTFKADGETTAGAFECIEERLLPGASTPAHRHSREDEYFYVLEGHITFYCGERTIQAMAGAFVSLPRGIVHSFQVDAAGPARALVLCAPAGLRGFFEAVGEPALAGSLAPTQPSDPAMMRRIALQYGIEIVGDTGERGA